MKMTQERVGGVLYELMDSAYDSALVRDASRSLDRVPIIEVNAKSEAAKLEKQQRARLASMGLPLAEDVRYRGRTVAERANARLKDEFGASSIRVRGHPKGELPPG